jgi:hypothetical protein
MGILFLIKKNCPLEIEWTEEINENLLKVSLKEASCTVAIFCVYGPSDKDDHEFFLSLRRAQLAATEDHTAVIGDLNTTIDPVLDRHNYTSDSHWKSRAVISEWIESGDLQDAFRHYNPEKRSFTWRKHQTGGKMARLDYVLLSPGLIDMMVNCYHAHHPWNISDHSSVITKLRFDKTEEGPGTFRAMPGIQKRQDYDISVRHLITEELLLNSKLNPDEKATELEKANMIFELSNNILQEDDSPEDKEKLAVLLSMQKTKSEIISSGLNIENDIALDYVIHKIGRATKKYQKDLKILQNNTLQDMFNELHDKKNKHEEDEEEILALEDQIDTIINICQQEAQKMSTFRLLHDEKSSKAMIDMEKKITGYSSLSKLNKPNPDYKDPEEGGSRDPEINPKIYS